MIYKFIDWRVSVSDSNQTGTTAVFLDDQPCHEVSAFEIHERISQAIAHEIQTGKPSNIALLGSWGSGKSTIVDRVEALLARKRSDHVGPEAGSTSLDISDYIYFKFDTWSHSGDSLRRNFLAKLADKLVAEGEIPEQSRNDLVDLIDGKKSTSRIQEDASFAPIVAATIVATMVFAASNIISTNLLPALRNVFVATGIMGQGCHTNLMVFIEPIPALAAILAFLFVWGAHKIRRDESGRLTLRTKRKTKKRDIVGSINMLAKKATDIFSKKADTTTITKHIDTSILDSLVFERTFIELVGQSKKPVVIVFDNLDRLSREDLRDAWNTLQIFATCFDQKEGTVAERDVNSKCAKPWIILPASNNAFQVLDEFTRGSDSINLSKMFIRIFEIPAPITSDWRNYFLSQARIAFPDSTEIELSTVYAIASHALLRIESRTPRNAKRFVNAMVAQARVFPMVSLISIAVFCFTKDSYSLLSLDAAATQSASEEIRTFNDFMGDVLTDSNPIASYVNSFTGYVDNLSGDLAMLTYGQFSYNAASEMFVASQMRSMFNGRKTVDIHKIVGANQGSWSLITKEVEEELANPSNQRPQNWIFDTLRSLSSCEETCPEKSHLASVLIGGIREIYVQSQPYGMATAAFISSCSNSTVLRLSGIICSELSTAIEEITVAENEENGRKLEAGTASLIWQLREAAPVFERVAKTDHALCDEIEQRLTDIELEDLYGTFVDECARSSRETDWLAMRPAHNLDELGSLLRAASEKVCEGSFDEPLILAVRNNGLFDHRKLESEDIRTIIRTYDADAPAEIPLNELQIACWLLVEICGVQSDCLSQILDVIDEPASGYELCAGKEFPHKNAAILAIAIANSDAIDFSTASDGFFGTLPNSDTVSFIHDHQIDLIPRSLQIIKERRAPLAAPCKVLVQALWGDDDYAHRDMNCCFSYFELDGSQAKRRANGASLAVNNRIDDLIATSFSFYWATVYLGALDALEENERPSFCKWLEAGIEQMSVEDWKKAIDLPQIERLAEVMRQVTAQIALPSLDEAIDEIACAKYPGEKKLEIVSSLMDAYKADIPKFRTSLTKLNASITKNFAGFAPFLKRCGWFEAITPESRYSILKAVIQTHKAYNCEAAASILAATNNPKRKFPRYLLKMKEVLQHQSSLKSMPAAGKKACEKMLELLA